MNLGASDYCEQFGQLVNLDPSLIIICAVVSSYRGASRSDVTKLSDWEVGAYLPIFCVEAASLGATFVAYVLECSPAWRRSWFPWFHHGRAARTSFSASCRGSAFWKIKDSRHPEEIILTNFWCWGLEIHLWWEAKGFRHSTDLSRKFSWWEAKGFRRPQT